MKYDERMTVSELLEAIGYAIHNCGLSPSSNVSIADDAGKLSPASTAWILKQQHDIETMVIDAQASL